MLLVLPELLDDGDECIFGCGSAFFDPLVENRGNGGCMISGAGNPTVELVECASRGLSVRAIRRRRVERNARCVSETETR